MTFISCGCNQMNIRRQLWFTSLLLPTGTLFSLSAVKPATARAFHTNVTPVQQVSPYFNPAPAQQFLDSLFPRLLSPAIFPSYRSTRSVSWKILKLIVSLKLETMFLPLAGNGSCHKSRFAGPSNQLAHAYVPFLSPRICKESCHPETYFQVCDCHFLETLTRSMSARIKIPMVML